MNKYILGIILGILIGAVLTGGIFLVGQGAETTVGISDTTNTYRDPKLLFSIKYPLNWSVTDYVDYDKNGGCVVYKSPNTISEKYGRGFRENCGEGTSLSLSSHPYPYEGWSVDNVPPTDSMSIAISVLPKDTVYRDRYEGEDTVVVTKEELDVHGSSNKLVISRADYEPGFTNGDMGLPKIYGHYYGDYYTYEFSMPSWGANTTQEIDAFKSIVSTFQEIR